MLKSQNHHIQCEKPNTKEDVLSDSIHIKFWEKLNSPFRKQTGGYMGLGFREGSWGKFGG